MLEHYYVRPDTVDHVRSSWVGESIEKYVEWLSSNGYASRTIWRRIPLLMDFGEFARRQGATKLVELPGQIEKFTWYRLKKHNRGCKGKETRRRVLEEFRNPVEQMLELVIPGLANKGRKPGPFEDLLPHFFDYLRNERGLKESTLAHYKSNLGSFEKYLQEIGFHELSAISPIIISGFVTNSSHLCKASLGVRCTALRVLLRYLYSEGIIAKDLSATLDSPRIYRLSNIPRSITWDEVNRMLAMVDHRTPLGKRDHAVLLLLITYGLRAREIAALTLENIDWRRERLLVPDRKAGNSTAYPLSPIVGEAILDYLQHGRPKTSKRHLFFQGSAPYKLMNSQNVSQRAAYYILKAGISINRPGSHTLRHTCVQRLVDADFTLKTIGDYVGHQSAKSTEIYAKVAVGPLREIGSGIGEDIL
jgi:site-specific recombinase XerD